MRLKFTPLALEHLDAEARLPSANGFTNKTKFRPLKGYFLIWNLSMACQIGNPNLRLYTSFKRAS